MHLAPGLEYFALRCLIFPKETRDVDTQAKAK